MAEVAFDAEPVEALHAATTIVIATIDAGHGVISRERLTQVARVLTATPPLREASRLLRFQILVPALARHLGVTGDDRAVQLALTMWPAVITASYKPAPPRHRRRRDGRRPEVMAGRLDDRFTRILGRPSASPR